MSTFGFQMHTQRHTYAHAKKKKIHLDDLVYQTMAHGFAWVCHGLRLGRYREAWRNPVSPSASRYLIIFY